MVVDPANELNRFRNILNKINERKLAGFNVSDAGLTKSKTGVSRAPYIDPYTAALMRGGRGGGGGGMRFGDISILPGQSATPIDWNSLVESSTKPYEALGRELGALTEAERQRINQATSAATTYLGEVDPMAAYRETYRTLEAPMAASSSYLGAIGANPAQVEAQRNLANQLMASQAAGQQGFAGAVDQASANYRLAQLADAYANQQRAQTGLGAASNAQQIALQMAAAQQRNQIAQMALEAQLRLMEIQAQQKGRGLAGSYNVDLSSLGF